MRRLSRPEALILAGGRGQRMGGVTKASLRLPDGQTVLDRLLTELAPVVSRSVLVAPHGADLGPLDGSRVSRFQDPGTGPANAMVAAASASEAERVFVLAADLPGLTADLLRWIEGAWTGGEDAVIPVHRGRAQPLVGLYLRSRLLQLALPSGASVHSLLERLRWRAQPTLELDYAQERGLLGFNTWEEAETWGIRRGHGLANGAGPQG